MSILTNLQSRFLENFLFKNINDLIVYSNVDGIRIHRSNKMDSNLVR